MQKWEYMVIEQRLDSSCFEIWDRNGMKRVKPDKWSTPTMELMMSLFSEAGQNGWELVDRNVGTYSGIFKRPIE